MLKRSGWVMRLQDLKLQVSGLNINKNFLFSEQVRRSRYGSASYGGSARDYKLPRSE